jgi:uroporphyrinogen decarboxylase
MQLPLDVEQFWRDDALAHAQNCFSKDAPQVALGIRMSGECVFAELGEPGNPWVETPRARRLELNKRYNDKAEKIVGKRLLPETLPPQDARFPYVKRIGEVFGGRYIIQNDTEWLTESAQTPGELEALLDRVEKLDLRAFMLPDNWEAEKKRIYETHGLRPRPLRHVRGPVTLACSLMGSENFIFLVLDEPELAKRFRDVICRVILDMAQIMDAEAGTDEKTTPGFSFADDNCCLMTPEMYELFGYPILKRVFDFYSPNPGDMRFQHSDSAMGHLLPILGRLNFTGVNFGPTVLIPQIRQYMPTTRIDGCLAPFRFMRNDEEAILREVSRDCADARAMRGVNLSTAGSINNGSLLTSMRLVMAIIQNYGRY